VVFILDLENEGAVLVENTVAIEAVAEVRAVKTCADFTLNVTLNLPENCKEQAKHFIDWQGKLIRIVAILEENK
jgi:hypothetical protein